MGTSVTLTIPDKLFKRAKTLARQRQMQVEEC